MTPVQLNSVQTLAVALIALQFGYWLLKRSQLLRRYYLPAPVIGGLAVALLTFTLRGVTGCAVKFDPTLQPLFFAGFFASIGFRASVKLIRQGLPLIGLFLSVTVVLAATQKLLGLGLGQLLGLTPAAGLLLGSAHMGGAALQALATPVISTAGAGSNLPWLGAMSSLGLLLGGCLGGPLYARLTGHGRSQPTQPPVAAPLNPPALLKHLAAYLLVLAVGQLLAPRLSPYLPAFAGALVAASLWRMADDAWQISQLDLSYINSLGNASLSICLALAFINLDLAKLAVLPPAAYLLMLVQVAMALLVAVFLVYRPLKRTPLAAMIAAGLPGFALGLPPDTMATLQNIQEQNGPAPLVTFVVPVVGAWLITFINPWLFNWVSSLL